MKRVCFILIFSILLSANVFAQEAGTKADASCELGVYVKDDYPFGEMAEHAQNFLGGGLSFVYNSPITFPMGQKRVQLGFIGQADYAYGFASSYVTKWDVVQILTGVLFEIPVNNWLVIMPGVEYGVQLHFVDSIRKANRLYLDQNLQISPTFKFLSKKGIALEASPAWTIGFEKSSSAQYAGMRFGVSFNLGKSKADIR